MRFALRRLALSVPTLGIVLVGLFLLLQFAPGDTVDAMLAQMGGGDTQLADRLRAALGLDATVPVRLGRYLWRLVRLDLGESAIYGKPVLTVILERLPTTLLLTLSALGFAVAGGVALGVLAARRVDGWPDTIISLLGLLFYATPSFWLGLMAIVVFAVRLGWLPAGGLSEVGASSGGVLDMLWHLILPVATLSLIFMAIYLRVMRASMLEVLGLDFVRTARAKGLTERAVLVRHVLRNALLPVLTLVGLQGATLLGGSVVIESVFSLPGLGRLAYESVVQRDLNMLLGIVFASTLLVITVNLVVDVLYARLDPRIAT